ncbi:MAG: NTP transferase domain-containing protein, partial [Muribaculaceae bacterium]|nr:NTP transferase domain-containing protein [Muribaculaceae bacterium]
MTQTEAIALIPARYASTRFPGKPLAKLGGESVIRRVCRQVEKAGIRPVVATDDERILREVEEGGYKAVMTSSTHCSGTDRICEALRLLEAEEGRGKGVVLNVQGDEPFIRPEQLRSLIEVFSDPEVKIATLVRRYEKGRGIEGLEDPNLVKVSTRANGDALTFSRSVLPHI